ncbi:MAG: type III pantothenate kinase [Chitinophagales bacterium]
MLIVIDLGNTNVVIGVYENGAWTHEWRMETQIGQSGEVYQQQLHTKIEETNLDIRSVRQIIMSSVVPALTDVIVDSAVKVFGVAPYLIGTKTYPHLPLHLPSSEEIGTDLVANAMAAMTHFPNRNCVVVDFGTALTFTTVSKEGKLLGVAIAPGIKTTIKALFLNAAQLPEVPLVVPDSVMGTNTFHAIQAGILIGFEGLVSHLLKRHRAELKEDCVVIATGGLSGVLENLKPEYDLIDRKLTLDGLRIIAELVNRVKDKSL